MDQFVSSDMEKQLAAVVDWLIDWIEWLETKYHTPEKTPEIELATV